jgi:hypothetical protein
LSNLLYLDICDIDKSKTRGSQLAKISNFEGCLAEKF